MHIPARLQEWNAIVVISIMAINNDNEGTESFDILVG